MAQAILMIVLASLRSFTAGATSPVHPFAGCAVAMSAACDAERKQGVTLCAMCAGAHQLALQKHNCTQLDITAFCSNQTCGTLLDSTCGPVRTDCAACSVCVSNHIGPGTVCQGSATTPFCAGACAQGLACDSALERLCESERRQGTVPCAMCAGQHKADLANCSNAQITSFCTNSSCIARLAQHCLAPSGGSGDSSCVSCANCTERVGSASGCSLAQQLNFCESVVPSAPPQPPSCDTVLGQACDEERKQGLIQCAECVGADKNRAAAHAANCSQEDIQTFCSNASCYTSLTEWCPRTVGDSGCGKCAACALDVTSRAGSTQFCTAAGIESFCTPLDPCDFPTPVSCGAHGSCKGGNCTCNAGWRGADCSQGTGCDNAPCKNGATCEATGASHHCYCAHGWKGLDCLEGTGCDTAPCKDGATCIASGSNHTCVCATGYKGFDCTESTGCDTNPCKNGATCIADGSNYSCACATGWEGADCTESTGCDTNPCKNGATCIADGSFYRCACATGWEGADCSIRLTVYVVSGCTVRGFNGIYTQSPVECNGRATYYNGMYQLYLANDSHWMITNKNVAGRNANNDGGYNCGDLGFMFCSDKMITPDQCQTRWREFVDPHTGSLYRDETPPHNSTGRWVTNPNIKVEASVACTGSPCGPHATDCATTKSGYYCTCEAGWIGPHCTQAMARSFVISGANHAEFSGIFDATSYICSRKPVYKQHQGEYALYIPSNTQWWMVGTVTESKDCKAQGYLDSHSGFCMESPDGAFCQGLWEEEDGKGGWVKNPNIKVEAKPTSNPRVL
jgi:hypothetical protein